MQPSDESTDPRDRIFELAAGTRGIGRRAGGASIMVLAVSFFKVALQLGSIAILARLIPPAEYAVFVLALPGVVIATALSNFGLPQAIIQKPAITHLQVSTLFWANAAFALVATVAVMLLSVPAAGWFDDPRVTPVFQVIAFSVLLSALSSQYIAIMRRTLRIRMAESMNLVAEVGAVVLAVLAALAGWSYWALVLQQLALPLINLVLLAVILRWWPSGPHRARFQDARTSLVFGGFVAGSSIMARLSEYIGTVIVGATLGATPTALYYRATNLAMMPQRRVMAPLAAVITPTLSRLQDDPAAQVALFGRFVSRSNLLLLPVGVGIATGAPWIVALLLGSAWTDVAPLLFWASMFTLSASLRGALQNLFFACGQSRPFFGVSVARLVLVALALFGLSRFGLETMMAGYMLTELLVLLPLTVAVATRVTPVRWRDVLQQCGADVVFAIALAAILLAGVVPRLEGWASVPALGILGLLIAAAYGVRVALSPTLRHDVVRALVQATGRGAGRRGDGNGGGPA